MECHDRQKPERIQHIDEECLLRSLYRHICCSPDVNSQQTRLITMTLRNAFLWHLEGAGAFAAVV